MMVVTKYLKNMTKRRFLCSVLFCVGVVVTLHVFYLFVDVENTFVNDDSQEKNEAYSTVKKKTENSESLIDENHEPVHFNYEKDQTHHDEHDIEGSDEKLPADKDIPIMLWWTPFTMVNQTRMCNLGECFTTNDRIMVNDNRTQVFLFYGTDVNASDLPLPRKANHEWALFHEESPKNNPILFHDDVIVLFNHTGTFRRYSDFPVVTQSLESIDVLEQKPLYTLEEKTSDKNRASVVYVQSACNAPSDRDVYVQELMKYLKVDSVGQCLNNKELPEEYKDSLTFSNKGFYKIIGTYKFTLAFENAICDDYITEKLWRPLEIGSVPIYRGSPSVLDWMPNNHSVILVDDFPSPKDLAEYIKQLDADDALYLKYLEFKQKDGVTNPRLLKHMKERKWNMVNEDDTFITEFECLICDRLYENLKRKKSGLPITKHVANHNHFGCPRPVQFNYPQLDGREQFDRDIWQKEFDENKIIGKALNKAARSGKKDFNPDKAMNDDDDTWF